MENFKDWKTTIPGLLAGLPLLLQGTGLDGAGSTQGSWLKILSGIGAILLGAYSNSKGK